MSCFQAFQISFSIIPFFYNNICALSRGRFELPTRGFSVLCSNQLSYLDSILRYIPANNNISKKNTHNCIVVIVEYQKYRWFSIIGNKSIPKLDYHTIKIFDNTNKNIFCQCCKKQTTGLSLISLTDKSKKIIPL